MAKGAGIDVEKRDGEEEEENMAAWLLGIQTLKIQPYKLPTLGPHDVKVRIKALGICGSDVHHFKVKGFSSLDSQLFVLMNRCISMTRVVGRVL
ncbi:L-idonate 5-dehydrogenase [Linum perenne]